MSAPEFERILAEHDPLAGGHFCSCQPVDEDGCRDVLPTTWDAHLAAALNAEVARWLADEGTREKVANLGAEALMCKRTCPDDCDGSRCRSFRRLLASGVWLAAQPALAALAPTDTTADEGGAR